MNTDRHFALTFDKSDMSPLLLSFKDRDAVMDYLRTHARLQKALGASEGDNYYGHLCIFAQGGYSINEYYRKDLGV